jgi:hypothetical protein
MRVISHVTIVTCRVSVWLWSNTVVMLSIADTSLDYYVDVIPQPTRLDTN